MKRRQKLRAAARAPAGDSIGDAVPKEQTVEQRRNRRNRAKGHELERQVAVALRPVFPDARRRLENHVLDATGVDLMGTGRYRIQCKRGHHYARLTAISEVQCDELAGEVPVLVTRADNSPPLVAISLDEFIRLLKSAMK